MAAPRYIQVVFIWYFKRIKTFVDLAIHFLSLRCWTSKGKAKKVASDTYPGFWKRGGGQTFLTRQL